MCGLVLRSTCGVDELLPATEAALVKCLLLRASYVGMAGDVAMLRSFASLWAERFAGAAGGAVAVGPINQLGCRA